MNKLNEKVILNTILTETTRGRIPTDSEWKAATRLTHAILSNLKIVEQAQSLVEGGRIPDLIPDDPPFEEGEAGRDLARVEPIDISRRFGKEKNWTDDEIKEAKEKLISEYRQYLPQRMEVDGINLQLLGIDSCADFPTGASPIVRVRYGLVNGSGEHESIQNVTGKCASPSVLTDEVEHQVRARGYSTERREITPKVAPRAEGFDFRGAVSVDTDRETSDADMGAWKSSLQQPHRNWRNEVDSLVD